MTNKDNNPGNNGISGSLKDFSLSSHPFINNFNEQKNKFSFFPKATKQPQQRIENPIPNPQEKDLSEFIKTKEVQPLNYFTKFKNLKKAKEKPEYWQNKMNEIENNKKVKKLSFKQKLSNLLLMLLVVHSSYLYYLISNNFNLKRNSQGDLKPYDDQLKEILKDDKHFSIAKSSNNLYDNEYMFKNELKNNYYNKNQQETKRRIPNKKLQIRFFFHNNKKAFMILNLSLILSNIYLINYLKMENNHYYLLKYDLFYFYTTFIFFYF